MPYVAPGYWIVGYAEGELATGLLIADSQQTGQVLAVTIGQTHRIGIANSQQVNRCSSIRVSDGSVQAPILTSHPHYIIKAPARRFIISK